MEANTPVAEDLCTYCDEPATTRDHVPPRLLFPPPRDEMVVVPACASCNGRYGRDDGYAQLVFSVDHRTGDHAAFTQMWPTVVRALTREGAGNFPRLLTGTLRPTLFQQANGLVVPTGVFQADLARLKQWSSRIARGLYRHLTGERLPLDVYLRSIWEEDLRDMEPEQREDFGRRTIMPIISQPEHSIQNGIFRYRLLLAEDDRFSGAMLMTFYDALHVLVLFQSVQARQAAQSP